jgi:type VI secretion system secreted protein VgrG
MATQPLMRLSTPLGDKLAFKRLEGAEELSRLYEYSVQALSTDNAITPAQLLGKPASVQLQLAGSAGDRHFHGLVTAMGLEGMDEGQYSYRLVLRPWLWLLTRRSDTRVFQNKNLQAILKEVFEPFSVDYKFQLSGTLPTYEYCVQYRESDFDFVSRLLEQEGVYYYFTHEKGKHTLVLVDRASAHPACAQAEVYYRETADTMLESETITGWQVLHEIQSGQAVLTDYDFEKPSTSLQSQSKAERSEASTKLEVYDYPGLYIDKAAGDRYSKLRVEELQAGWVRSSGGGSVRALATGHTFTLKEHPRADQNTKHLLVSTRIEAQYAGYRSGAADSYFRVRFTALPAAEQFRPARHTPKPLVHGPQTAVVVGPAGDEIHTDKYGRVKIQFHWDRLGKKDAASSCWVRVSHPSAGKGFGGIALPRIGQEVVVSFLDGDPDRPLITGRVYNAEQMPPLALPANATISTLRSRSSKGGGDSDFNELRFEDKKGDEHVWFQAQKDYYQHVKHDAQVVVDNNEAILIGNARTETIGGSATLSVAGDATQEFANNLSTTVATAHTHTVGAAQAVTVGANHILTIGGALLQNIGGAADVEVGGNYALQAAANLHIKAGANLVIEAGTMITLKAGGASVVIGGPGVSVTGSMVMINSGGAPGAGAGAKAEKAKKAEKPAKVEKKKDPVG